MFDVTNPDAAQEIAGKIAKQNAGGFQVTMTPSAAGQRQLLVIANAQTFSPARLAANRPSSLRTSIHAASFVIISNREFAASGERLKAARAGQGFKVETVDVEDIYDEFSFGNKSPQAIKDFLQYARISWKTGPQYVLLIGDASFDPKNYLGYGDWDKVATKLIDTQLMEAASDDWFADSDDAAQIVKTTTVSATTDPACAAGVTSQPWPVRRGRSKATSAGRHPL